MHIIIILLFIVFFVIAVGATLLRSILNIFLSPFRNTQSGASEGQKAGQSRWRRTTTSESNRKKIFDKNDGEYVDFEEIKED